MKRSILGVLLVLTFVAVGIAAAPPLTFTFKDVHANKTALETDTYAVNDFGTIAGDFVDSSGIQHGMIHGIPTTSFDYSKCSSGIAAYGINKSCTVAGWCGSATGTPIGFTRTKDGTFTDVNFPNGIGTEATGINDKGDVVGLYFDANGVQHGFLLKSGTYTTIDVPGESTTAAWGINNSGMVTVEAINSGGLFDAWVYNIKTKKFKKVNVTGATESIVHTINNKGDIVYTYDDSSGRHGGLFHGGKFFAVDDPNGTGSNGTRADGINDSLVIVGRYSPSDGSNHGFKATTK